MYVLTMLMILVRQLSCLRTVLRWCQVSLSELEANELLHMLIAFLNLCLENSFHEEVALFSISLRISTLTWQWITWLNMSWNTFYRLSGIMHSCLLNLIALVASNLHLLIQFINSQGLRFLFTTSWIFVSKKDCLVFLTTFLNIFQFSRLLVIL